MLLKINNENIKDIAKAIAITCLRADYNSDCYSCGDVRRYLDLCHDITDVINSLKEHGINILVELKTELKKNQCSDWISAFEEAYKDFSDDKNLKEYNFKAKINFMQRILPDDLSKKLLETEN